jgi:hypothetical protein
MTDPAPIDNRVFVLILQHPQEKAEPLGTAGLLRAGLANADLRAGLSWPGLKRILGREVDHRRWGVLHLGPATIATKGKHPVMLVDRKGQPLEGASSALSELEGLVVLDGTWSQAKTLWWRNAWLLKLQRLVLRPDFTSRYGSLRREPRPEALSTLESVGFALSKIERNPEIFTRLSASFEELVQRLQANGPIPTPKGPTARRGRRDRRDRPAADTTPDDDNEPKTSWRP